MHRNRTTPHISFGGQSAHPVVVGQVIETTPCGFDAVLFPNDTHFAQPSCPHQCSKYTGEFG